jgi:hypothetical protein
MVLDMEAETGPGVEFGVGAAALRISSLNKSEKGGGGKERDRERMAEERVSNILQREVKCV